MDLNDYMRTVFALLFVLGLIGLLYLLARQYASRRFGIGGLRGGLGGRLSVVEVSPVDGRRRLVLIRRDEIEHLVMLGPEQVTVIESGIPARPAFDAALAGAAEREPRL